MQQLLRAERERECLRKRDGKQESNNINHKSSNISWQLQDNQTTDRLTYSRRPSQTYCVCKTLLTTPTTTIT